MIYLPHVSLGIFGGYAFKMGVRHVVENHAAVGTEKALSLGAQGGLGGFAFFGGFMK